ncbi:MAG: hypothetical protein ACO3JL_19940, partial [Myxococcota bacterium]
TGERGGVAYHLGVSVVRGVLNQALFAAHQSGALCLALGSDEIRALSDGGFPFSAGTLNTLTGGLLEGYTPSAAPALLALAPATPPLVRYGEGTTEEGHVLVDWRDLRLHFYVYLYERYARLVAVDVDIELSLRAVYDEDSGTLELAVVSGPTLNNYRQVYGEMLPGVDFVELLEGLVGSLLDQALGDQLQFQIDLGLGALLSDALGTPLDVRLQDIATTGPAGTRERLQLYFELVAPVAAEARMRPLQPGPLRIVANASSLDVQALGPDADAEVEALFRLDDGLWRGPVQGTIGALSLPLAYASATGEHRLSLRARRRGSRGSYAFAEGSFTTPASATATPPRVTVLPVEGGLLAEASFPHEGLRWRFVLDGKSLGFGESPLLRHEDIRGRRRLTVEAQTGAGLTSRPVTIDLATKRWRRP